MKLKRPPAWIMLRSMGSLLALVLKKLIHDDSLHAMREVSYGPSGNQVSPVEGCDNSWNFEAHGGKVIHHLLIVSVIPVAVSKLLRSCHELGG